MSDAAALPGPYLGFQLKHLGDFLMTLPALAFLKERTGQKVGLALNPQIAAVLREGGSREQGFAPELVVPAWVDEVFVLDRRGGPSSVFETAGAIRKRGYKTAFIFDGQTRSIVAASLAGLRNRVGAEGLYRPSLPWLYNRWADIKSADWPLESQAYRAQKMAAAALGLPAGPLIRPRLRILDQPSLERAEKLLHSLDGDGPLVGLALRGMQPEKSWPLANFAELCRRLGREFRARLFVVGGPSESPMAQALAEAAALPVADFCGATSLRTLLALTAGCDLFIGIDTGPAHVAALSQMPQISIYTWTSPALWPPLNPRAKIFVYDWALRRFGLSPQDGPWHHAPVVSPEMVFEAAAEILRSAEKRSKPEVNPVFTSEK